MVIWFCHYLNFSLLFNLAYRQSVYYIYVLRVKIDQFSVEIIENIWNKPENGPRKDVTALTL